MRRFIAVLTAAVLLTAFARVEDTRAVGACIGPITKSAVYTYADRYAHILYGDPVIYSKFKLTGTFCYDGMGHAWGTSPITWQRVSGSAFLGISNYPTYVVITGYAYADLEYGYFAVYFSPPSTKMRIHPRLRINGTTGSFYAFDNGASLVNGAGQTMPDYDPVFVSATIN